jgi:subtilisin
MEQLMKKFPYLYLLAVFLFFFSSLLQASPSAQVNSTSGSSISGKGTATEMKRLAKIAHEKGSVRILVGLKESLNAKDFAKFKQQKGKRATGLLEFQQKALMADVPVRNKKAIKQYEELPYMALSVTEDELKKLRKSGRVKEIFEDHIDHIQAEETRTIQPIRESITQIGANTDWNLGYTGKGQAIAVIDSGVDSTHPYLQGKVINEACFSTRIEEQPSGLVTVNPVCRGGRTSASGKRAAQANCRVGETGCAHGTYVSVLAAGNSRALGFQGSGAAPEANIIGIKAESKFNKSEDCAPEPAPCKAFFTSDELRSLNYVLKLNRTTRGRLHIAAVNMSLGGSAAGRCFRGPVRRAIQLLKKANIATIVSSGNDGFHYDISFPACIPEAISVGATKTEVTEDVIAATKTTPRIVTALLKTEVSIADFSNGAPTLDLLAPGNKIFVPYFAIDPIGATASELTDDNVISGTSFSAPLVAGAWAALKSHKPNASVNEILQVLQNTGVGVIDFNNATIKSEIRVDRAHSALTP